MLVTRAWLIVLGGLLLATLVGLKVYLARRFRWILNAPLLAATALVIALTGTSLALTSSVGDDPRAAKQDTFDSILALNPARAVSYDANADESRYLVDPDGTGRYEETFLAKTQQLVALDGATVAAFDGALDTALQA